MSAGYSAVQTARLVSALRWACGRLSEILGVWAGQAAAAGGSDETAVHLSVLSRRLASHRQVLDDLQPDSERLAEWRQPGPADVSLAGALDEIAVTEGPPECLAVAEEVFVPQLAGVYERIGEHAAPHCDAALASVARLLRHDLDRETTAAGSGQPGGVEAAHRALSGAGGLVGPDVLRPEDWP